MCWIAILSFYICFHLQFDTLNTASMIISTIQMFKKLYCIMLAQSCIFFIEIIIFKKLRLVFNHLVYITLVFIQRSSLLLKVKKTDICPEIVLFKSIFYMKNASYYCQWQSLPFLFYWESFIHSNNSFRLVYFCSIIFYSMHKLRTSNIEFCTLGMI